MITASDILEGPNAVRRRDGIIAFADDAIASISDHQASGPRRLVIPGLVNAHDHARPMSPTSFGAAARPLETWLLRLAAMPATDPYLAALAAFGRAARAGCVSIMAHYTRLHGPMPAPDEAALVAKAAGDIGVRATFALAMRDRNPLVYGNGASVLAEMSPPAEAEIDKLFGQVALPFGEQIALAEACAAAAQNPMFTVQYGPAGVQWCSNALLEAVADASARTGRRVHMHLLETQSQRAFADANYSQGVVQYLKDIGLLSPRLTLAHCVHARPAELELIAQSGATIVTNFSSNLHLRSGIAPIAEAIARGCRVAIGIDASALDEDDDALREMRLGHFAHGGFGFGPTVGRETFLMSTVGHGRHANGVPGSGALMAGEAADMVVLDLDRLDRDAIMPVDPLDYLFARANASHITEVVVAGRSIVRDGRLLHVDLEAVHEELRARYRRDMPGKAGFLAAWPQIETAVSRYFRDNAGCC